MRLVVESLRCERACRALAAKLTNPNDKRALELMAAGWARRAAERLRKMETDAAASLAPLGPPPRASCNRAVETARWPVGNVDDELTAA